ncbi:MAG: hypothetical protein WBI82_11365 [Sphaerochaeta sp.]
MPPFPPQGAGYLTLLSRHSLGNGIMVMLVLLSLRWGIKAENHLGNPWIFHRREVRLGSEEALWLEILLFTGVLSATPLWSWLRTGGTHWSAVGNRWKG